MLAAPTLRAASSSSSRRVMSGARYNSTQAGRGAESYGSATRSTVPPRSTHATYHPGGYGISEGLKRARKPYQLKNILTGSLIMGFATSVYFYSISKVRILMLLHNTRHGLRTDSSFPLWSAMVISCDVDHRSSKTIFQISPRSGRLVLAPLHSRHLSQPSLITSTKYERICNNLNSQNISPLSPLSSCSAPALLTCDAW